MDTELFKEVLGKLQNFISQNAGPAWDMLCDVKQVESIATAVLLLAAIVISLSISYTFRNLRWDHAYDYDEVNNFKVFMRFVGIVVAIILVSAALLSPWMWIGMFRPDLAIIHDIYVSLTQ